MRGQVLSFDAASGAGWISGQDGLRYSFTTGDLAAPVPVHSGAQLDFVPVGSMATQVMAAPGFATAAAATASSGGMFSPVTPDPVGEPELSIWAYAKRCMRKYADFNGRARRKEYWSFVLVELALFLPLYAVGMVFMIVAVASSPSSPNGPTSELSPEGAVFMLIAVVLFLLAALFRLAVFLPSYAVLARRFHDVGLSAWWILIAFVPILGAAVIIPPFMPSQPGANIYGGYPKPVR